MRQNRKVGIHLLREQAFKIRLAPFDIDHMLSSHGTGSKDLYLNALDGPSTPCQLLGRNGLFIQIQLQKS
jgi:hypothetical protein